MTAIDAPCGRVKLPGIVAHAVLAWLCGLFWAVSGIGKAIRVVQSLAAGEEWRRITYVDEFPQALILLVVIAEVTCAFLFFASRARLAAIVGLCLLALFVVVLSVLPPRPETVCGCAGSVQSLAFDSQVNPIARNTLLVGIHAMILAMTPRRVI